MIVFVTTKDHAYTVRSLIDGTFGVTVPSVRQIAYDEFFHWTEAPAATYIFTDIDRLFPWERVIAHEFYHTLIGQGNLCLNNPARVLTRFSLLFELQRKGMNPFKVYRADEHPKPERFPVFIRAEFSHRSPVPQLIQNQHELENALESMTQEGWSRTGLLVVEFCAEPIAKDRWRRWATFRLGSLMHTDNAVIEDSWVVKWGRIGLANEAMFQQEAGAVAANLNSEALRPVFDLANIEYGRADYAIVGGKIVTYEINTNPYLGGFKPHPHSELRTQTVLAAKRRFSDFLAKIDGGSGHPLPLSRSDLVSDYVKSNPPGLPGFRP